MGRTERALRQIESFAPRPERGHFHVVFEDLDGRAVVVLTVGPVAGGAGEAVLLAEEKLESLLNTQVPRILERFRCVHVAEA